MRLRGLGSLALGLGCIASTGSLFASTIIGSAQIGGSLSSGGATVSATGINFGTGAFVEQSAGTGSFLGVTGGTLKNLVGPPLTGAVSVSQFATFVGGAVTPIFFDLTFINPGTGTAAQCLSGAVSSSTCTPAGSPFTLQQLTATTVSVTLDLLGVSYDITGNPKSPTEGAFSTQLVLQGTIPQIIATLGSGGSVNASYSATFVATPPATVPEPGTLLLMGVALIGLPTLSRRFTRR